MMFTPNENKIGMTRFSLKWLQYQKEKVQVKRGDLRVLIGLQNEPYGYLFVINEWGMFGI